MTNVFLGLGYLTQNDVFYIHPFSFKIQGPYIDLIYIANRKIQDLPSKLGAWGPWERMERERIDREGSKENVELNKYLFKKNILICIK